MFQAYEPVFQQYAAFNGHRRKLARLRWLARYLHHTKHVARPRLRYCCGVLRAFLQARSSARSAMAASRSSYQDHVNTKPFPAASLPQTPKIARHRAVRRVLDPTILPRAARHADDRERPSSKRRVLLAGARHAMRTPCCSRPSKLTPITPMPASGRNPATCSKPSAEISPQATG